MAGMRRAGPGLRAGRIVGRFHDVEGNPTPSLAIGVLFISASVVLVSSFEMAV